jgi:hypothetical protein
VGSVETPKPWSLKRIMHIQPSCIYMVQSQMCILYTYTYTHAYLYAFMYVVFAYVHVFCVHTHTHIVSRNDTNTSILRLAVSQEPCPSVSQEPCPSVSQEPCPLVSQEPCPSVSQEPCPLVSQEPCPLFNIPETFILHTHMHKHTCNWVNMLFMHIYIVYTYIHTQKKFKECY